MCNKEEAMPRGGNPAASLKPARMCSTARGFCYVRMRFPVADMVTAFHYVFGAASTQMACTALCILLMEERPLVGPSTPAEMAE
jgi:hypothetical protein